MGNRSQRKVKYGLAERGLRLGSLQLNVSDGLRLLQQLLRLLDLSELESYELLLLRHELVLRRGLRNLLGCVLRLLRLRLDQLKDRGKLSHLHLIMLQPLHQRVHSRS